MNMFKRATTAQAKLRMALTGISNSGKTWTSLCIAAGLGGPIALIDTERGSASKYAGYFEFDVLELATFHPEKYIEAITAAGENGYAICIIDSLSHAWFGEGGALDLHHEHAKSSDSANSYFAWREITPLQNQLVEAILKSPCHVLATLRSKAEYHIERDSRGKSVPKKIGLAPIQRQGLEYEFDLFGTLDEEHTLEITKSRFPRLSGTIRKPGKEFGRLLADELSGETPPQSEREVGAQAADEVYGAGAGQRLRQNGAVSRTQPVQAEMLGVEDDAVLPQIHGGETFIEQINACMRANGADDDAIQAYWHSTCRRCKVNSPVSIKTSWLPKLLDERREYYQKREQAQQVEYTPQPGYEAPVDWRVGLADLAMQIPESEETTDLHAEVAAALVSQDTPEDIGLALLQRVQGMATIQVGK